VTKHIEGKDKLIAAIWRDAALILSHIVKNFLVFGYRNSGLEQV
jgi:hypothetical protein